MTNFDTNLVAQAVAQGIAMSMQQSNCVESFSLGVGLGIAVACGWAGFWIVKICITSGGDHE